MAVCGLFLTSRRGLQLQDYHGGCDLVLLANEDFDKGLGMRIHVRTKYVSTLSSQIDGIAYGSSNL